MKLYWTDDTLFREFEPYRFEVWMDEDGWQRPGVSEQDADQMRRITEAEATDRLTRLGRSAPTFV